MDLNELFSRHQIALIEMTRAPTAAGRERAEGCADYYAGCITTLRSRFGVPDPISDHIAVKGLVRG